MCENIWGKVHHFLSSATRKLALGTRGEHCAARYLRRNLYFVWLQNWKHKSGEIDLIAIKNRRLIFVEVKTRSGKWARHLPGMLAVDRQKQQKLLQLAHFFIRNYRHELQRRRILGHRFDVISISSPAAFLPLWVFGKVQHVKDWKMEEGRRKK